jgi:E3 ubiquitin-protein ligase DRIP
LSLHLQVEITCHGEPVSPSSTLQGLIDLCVRRETGKPIEASLGAPAKEFVMVLGYRRRRQLAPAP